MVVSLVLAGNYFLHLQRTESRDTAKAGRRLKKQPTFEGPDVMLSCTNFFLLVDGHFGYFLFCLNSHEKGKYVQSSIQPKLK